VARETVIARAFRGEPLKRVAVDFGEKVIYLANPELLKAVEVGDSAAVGFPAEHVYVFDKSVFYELEAEWNETGATTRSVWEKLERFHPR
jgi:hypothetical protein